MGRPGSDLLPRVGGRDDYASWPYRAAYLIDLVVALLPTWIARFIAGQVGPTDPAAALIEQLGELLTLVIAAWNLWYTQGRTGQSLGKLVVGTRLVSEGTGQPVGGLTAFLRSVAHLVDALPCFVGYLWPIRDARRQTFADKLAGTVVVKA